MMSAADGVGRLCRSLGAARKAIARGERPDARQLRDLVREVDSRLCAGAEQAPMARPQLLALLDEAGALCALLEQEQEAARRAIDAETRRRFGRTAYRPSRRG